MEINRIRQDVAAIKAAVQETVHSVSAIQAAVQSVLARLDTLSAKESAESDYTLSNSRHENVSTAVLNDKDEARQQDIIESGNGYDAYRFAKKIAGADIQALQQVVLKRGDGWDAYAFAKYITGADIPTLYERLVALHSTGDDMNTETGEKGYLHRFNNDHGIQFRLRARMQQSYVDDVSTPANPIMLELNATQRDITERGDAKAAYGLVRAITSVDVTALQNVVIEHGNGWLAYCFAADVNGADIEALQQVVLDRGDGCEAYYFALHVDGANLVALHDRLVHLHSTGDDIDRHSGEGPYLEKFNEDTFIQARLKAQVDAAGLSEPEGITRSKKYRPS